MHAPFETIGPIEAIGRSVFFYFFFRWLWRGGKQAVKGVEEDLQRRSIEKAKRRNN